MMNEKHNHVCKLKDLRSQLGKTPTRREYTALYGYSWETEFGLWSIFLESAGMATNEDKKKNSIGIVNAYFNKQYDELKGAKKELLNNCRKYPRIAIAGDTHFCFQNDAALNIFYNKLKKLKPDIVLQIGDIVDAYSASKFPKQITMTPKEEFTKSRELAENFWTKIKAICPKAKLVQLLGNHDARMHKRMIEHVPELEHFFDFDSYFKFKGVYTHFDTREAFYVEDIAFIHGFMSGQGMHRKKLLTNVCHGHSHRGGLVYSKVDGKLLWELDAGYLGDPSKAAFRYTPVREQHWTLGMGYISELGPHFIPFE